MQRIQTITPCLWFDHQAQEAAQFYCSIFEGSRITHVSHYGKAGFEFHGRPEGSVMSVVFELDGQAFTALNGGPAFTFNEAISLQVHCRTQAELDHYWNALGLAARHRPSNAAGSRTASACPGRSCRRSWHR